ncbi:MAG: peptidoglycan DD-metalloendopeptidase family protein [Deinococcota bacterium]
MTQVEQEPHSCSFTRSYQHYKYLRQHGSYWRFLAHHSRVCLLVLGIIVVSLSGWSYASGMALCEVRPGDTLSAIALRYNVSITRIKEENELRSDTVYAGQVLRIPYAEAVGGTVESTPLAPPGFELHTLTPEETLSEVMDAYDVSLQAIVGANPDLSSFDQLPAGLELLIPPSEGLIVTLEHGQTVADILDIYGLSAVELATANGIREPTDLRPGQTLFLPGVPPMHVMARLEHVREQERLAEAMENRYTWPLQGRLTSRFGPRRLGMGTSNFHTGLDIAAPYGSEVVAARSGTVTFAGWSGAYGYTIKVRHHGGSETWYAHNSNLHVDEGAYVERGELLANVGSTGLSTGPHLHFEIRENNRPVNPLVHLN